MSNESPKKEDCGDDTKRDQVLKKLLGTPHKPHQVPKKKKAPTKKPGPRS